MKKPRWRRTENEHHLDFVSPADRVEREPIARGMPTYIDKPLTCSLDQAKSLLAMTRQYKAASGHPLRNLSVAPQRVGGDLLCPPSPDLDCAAHFSAPLFTD